MEQCKNVPMASVKEAYKYLETAQNQVSLRFTGNVVTDKIIKKAYRTLEAYKKEVEQLVEEEC